ncbi:hypothetical protein MP228_000252 [Amoeboaphelidium protococcarum]|nr:hypothetical protein MP228_000252 [Amoeboaphelidium protococcarum]
MKIEDVNLLVVGAGGIGCELLKNLVLAGFPQMTVVDLDTIDLSNLNRQFLFRSHHIKQSKSKVACEAVKAFAHPSIRSKLNIEALHANIITDPRFTVEFFSQFDIIINALDNLESRSHVNRMAVVCNKPSIESGTAGLNGQATIHIPGITQCFDCVPKTPDTKSFAVCTIRSTPSLPIHCIVWAKSWLFNVLFGESSESSPAGGDGANNEDDNAEELAQLQQEQQELSQLRQFLLSKDAVASQEDGKLNEHLYSQRVFDKIFDKDVLRVASVDEMWNKPGRVRPVPLCAQDLKTDKNSTVGSTKADNTSRDVDDEHSVWSLQRNYAVFIESCSKLARRFKDGNGESLEFDKDDEDAMRFVTAASNLRSHIYHIKPQKSLFEAKQMAGNIIPAVASSNAIVAAFQTRMALKIADKLEKGVGLQQCLKSLMSTSAIKKVYLSYEGKHWLQPDQLESPAKDCAVCSSHKVQYQILQLDCSKIELSTLVEAVRQSMGGSDISISTSAGSLLYDEDFDDNLEKALKDFMPKQSKQLVLNIQDDDEIFTPLQLFVIDGACVQDVGKITLSPLLKKPVVVSNKRRRSGSDEDEAPQGDGSNIESSDSQQQKKAKVEIVIDDSDAIVFDE